MFSFYYSFVNSIFYLFILKMVVGCFFHYFLVYVDYYIHIHTRSYEKKNSSLFVVSMIRCGNTNWLSVCGKIVFISPNSKRNHKKRWSTTSLFFYLNFIYFSGRYFAFFFQSTSLQSWEHNKAYHMNCPIYFSFHAKFFVFSGWYFCFYSRLLSLLPTLNFFCASLDKRTMVVY